MHRSGDRFEDESSTAFAVVTSAQVFPGEENSDTNRGSVITAAVGPQPQTVTFMKVALMYLRDAACGRKPLPAESWQGPATPGSNAAIAAHALHWDWRVRGFFRALVVFHVCFLAELQCDAITDRGDGIQLGVYRFLTMLEIGFCGLYAFDGFVQVRMHFGTWHWRWVTFAEGSKVPRLTVPHKVTVMQLAVAAFIIVDDSFSLFGVRETVVAPFVRPLFIMCFYENVLTIITNVMKIIPDTLPTLFLLGLHIGIFATVGHIFMRNYLFESQKESDGCAAKCVVYAADDPGCAGCEMFQCQVRPGDLGVKVEWIEDNCPGTDTWVWDRQSYFGTVSEAYVSLFICLSTANFPDIATPYIRSKYMSKNVIRAYFVTFLVAGRMILLNLCVGTIYNSYKDRHRVSIGERLGFRKRALALLHDALTEGGLALGKHSDPNADVAFDRGVCVRVLAYMRTDLELDLLHLFVKTADVNENGYLSVTQLVQLCDVVMSAEAHRDAARPDAWPKWRRNARRIVQLPWFDHVTSFLVVVVFVCVLGQYTHPDLVETCAHVLVALTLVFAVEIFLRISGKGLMDYWMEDALHRIDLVCVSLALVMHIFARVNEWAGGMSRTEASGFDSLAKVLVLARLSRIVQVVQVNDDLKRLVKIIASVLPIARRYIIGLVFFIAMFAPVGMALTKGAPPPVESAHGISNYGQNYTYDSFFDASFSLFIVWIGNNWHILMSGMVEQTSEPVVGRCFHCVYFVLITTIYCTCVEAFIFDCIDCQTNLYHEHGTTNDREPWMEEIDAVQARVQAKGEADGNLKYCKFWKFRAKVTIMDMYRRLFDEEDLAEFLADSKRSAPQVYTESGTVDEGEGKSSLPRPPRLRAGTTARASILDCEPPRGSLAGGAVVVRGRATLAGRDSTSGPRGGVTRDRAYTVNPMGAAGRDL